MAINWSEFDNQIDTKALAADVAESANNTKKEHAKVPFGQYEVSIQKLELTKSKSKGEPMLSCWFKIVAGTMKGNLIFMNRVITKAYPIHQCNEFLKAITKDATDVPSIEFINYSQYNHLIMDIAEIIHGKFEYALKYYDNKGYDGYEITEIYPLE